MRWEMVCTLFISCTLWQDSRFAGIGADGAWPGSANNDSVSGWDLVAVFSLACRRCVISRRALSLGPATRAVTAILPLLRHRLENGRIADYSAVFATSLGIR